MSSHPFGYESWADFFWDMENLPSFDELEGDETLTEEPDYRLWLSDDQENMIVVSSKTKKVRIFPVARFRELREISKINMCWKCGAEIGFYFDIDSTDLVGLRCLKCNTEYKLLEGGLYLLI